jgi:hypothetical protein
VLVAVLSLAAGMAACSGDNPAASATRIEPIQIDSVDVLVSNGSPAQVTAHVKGVLGDGCSTLHSVRQQRSGSTVAIEILRERPAEAVCIQVARLYDELIRLEGEYPPGRYLLRVNSVERAFTVE